MHKFGYTAESLLKDKVEGFEKELESQNKLTTIRIDNLEKYINENNDLDNLREIKFLNFDSEGEAETHVLVNAKLFIDINKLLADFSINLKYLEQESKNKLLEQRKEIILEATKIIEERERIKRNEFQKQMIDQLQTCRTEAVRDVIQLLYQKGLFDNFENKDSVFEKYLAFTDQYLLEKYGNEIKFSDTEVYYLSDLNYSVREDILFRLQEIGYKDVVDMRHRMKLTDSEIEYVLFPQSG